MKFNPQMALRPPALLSLALLVVVFSYLEGFRVNMTGSIPVGLYRIVDEPVVAGRLVLACLPEELGVDGVERGYMGRRRFFPCPGGVAPAMKLIAALGGDRVLLHERGLDVNGAPFARWSNYYPDPGRPMELPARFHLAADELWLSGVHPRSWDSRHFGPIPRPDRLAVIRPVWIDTPEMLEPFPLATAERSLGGEDQGVQVHSGGSP